MIRSRYQQYIHEAHHRRRRHELQLEPAGEKAVEVCRDHRPVESTTTSICSNASDVSKHDDDDDDEMKRGSQCSSSDVILSLRHSSCPSVSALCRPVYIHRPFEDAAAPLQLKDTQRYLDDDKPAGDYRLQALTGEEPRRGWLADRHHQLGSIHNGGVSWQQQQQMVQRAAVVDDEAVDTGSSAGDSACCDDDDVTDEQVRGVKTTNDSQTEHHDVISDDTTSHSDSNYYQPQHGRKPPGLYECRFYYDKTVNCVMLDHLFARFYPLSTIMYR